MRRANLWLLLVCLAFIAGLLFLATMRKVAQKPVTPVAVSPRAAAASLPPSPSRPALAPPAALSDKSGHPDAASFGTPAIPPEHEPELILGLLEFYRREFGAFPTGNENAHFLNALAGTNPSGLVIFPPGHPRVSAAGDLLDAWGNPFHFHAISRDHLEVRSAGPDGGFFTPDDLVAPTPRGSP